MILKSIWTLGLLSVCGALAIGCDDAEQGSSGEWAGSIADSQGEIVVCNPAAPLLGELTLELE